MKYSFVIAALLSSSVEGVRINALTREEPPAPEAEKVAEKIVAEEELKALPSEEQVGKAYPGEPDWAADLRAKRAAIEAKVEKAAEEAWAAKQAADKAHYKAHVERVEKELQEIAKMPFVIPEQDPGAVPKYPYDILPIDSAGNADKRTMKEESKIAPEQPVKPIPKEKGEEEIKKEEEMPERIKKAEETKAELAQKQPKKDDGKNATQGDQQLLKVTKKDDATNATQQQQQAQQEHKEWCNDTDRGQLLHKDGEGQAQTQANQTQQLHKDQQQDQQQQQLHKDQQQQQQQLHKDQQADNQTQTAQQLFKNPRPPKATLVFQSEKFGEIFKKQK